MIQALPRVLAPFGAAATASAGVFALSAASPGNPLAHTVANWEFISAQARANLTAAYATGGWLSAWASWVHTAITSGQLGYSRTLHAPVLDIIATRGLNTIAATTLAAVITAAATLAACLLLAVFPKLSRRTWLSGVIGVWLAIPSFFIAVLIVVFAGRFLYNPATTAPIVMAPSVALTIAITWTAPLVASARAAASEVWATPWARALVGRGLDRSTIVITVLPSLLAAAGSYALLFVPQLVVGEAAVEAVLAYPGLGNALAKAAAGADLPLLAAVTGLAAACATGLVVLRRRPVAWTP